MTVQTNIFINGKRLTDGSIVYDVVLKFDDGEVKSAVEYHCQTERDAWDLATKIKVALVMHSLDHDVALFFREPVGEAMPVIG